MLDYLIFAIISSVSLVALILYIYPSKQKKVLIPGPSPSDPKDGNLGDIVSAHGLANYLQELHFTYGPIVSFQWGERVIVSIASPELFTEQEHVFNKPGELFHHYLPLLNTSALFLNNGVEGRRSHILVEQSLTSTRLGEVFPSIFQEVAHRFHDAARKPESQHYHDLQNLSEELVFYPLMICFFGASLVKQERELFAQLKTNFDLLWMEINLNVQAERNICNKTIRESSEKEVRSLLSQLCNRLSSSLDNDGDSTVACLKSRQSANNSPSLNSSLVEDMMALMTVSYPTLTALLVWLVYFIKRHPDTVEKELLEEMKLESSSYDNKNPVDFSLEKTDTEIAAIAKDNFDWLHRMKFLHCCIEETLRMANIFPWTVRVSDTETMLGGYRIPVQTPVIQALSVVHLSEDVFPNAQKFLPYRFFGKTKNPLPSLGFVPFGFSGKRRCPGSKLVYLLLGTIVNHLWSNYDVKVQIKECVEEDKMQSQIKEEETSGGDGGEDSCSECSLSAEMDDEPGGLAFVSAKTELLVPLPACTLLISVATKTNNDLKEE